MNELQRSVKDFTEKREREGGRGRDRDRQKERGQGLWITEEWGKGETLARVAVVSLFISVIDTSLRTDVPFQVGLPTSTT